MSLFGQIAEELRQREMANESPDAKRCRLERERRCKVVSVGEEAVLYHFSLMCSSSMPHFVNVPRMADLPPGYSVGRVTHDLFSRCFLFEVFHESFDPVQPGERPPQSYSLVSWESVRVAPQSPPVEFVYHDHRKEVLDLLKKADGFATSSFDRSATRLGFGENASRELGVHKFAKAKNATERIGVSLKRFGELSVGDEFFYDLKWKGEGTVSCRKRHCEVASTTLNAQMTIPYRYDFNLDDSDFVFVRDGSGRSVLELVEGKVVPKDGMGDWKEAAAKGVVSGSVAALTPLGSEVMAQVETDAADRDEPKSDWKERLRDIMGEKDSVSFVPADEPAVAEKVNFREFL